MRLLGKILGNSQFLAFVIDLNFIFHLLNFIIILIRHLLEKYLPVRNFKNLYSFIFNSIGLTGIFVYLTEPLFHIIGWKFTGVYTVALLFFTVVKPKVLTRLFLASLLIRLCITFVNISELPVAILVFLFSSLSLEFIVLISLKLELDESCYYEPDFRMLSYPSRHERVLVSFNSNVYDELILVDVSENYMTLISLSKNTLKVKKKLP